MLKKYAFKKIIISSTALFILLLISLIPNQKNTISENINVNNPKLIKIFVENKDQYLSQVSINKVDNLDDIDFIISVLTKKSVNSTLVPIGFNAILPENTKLLDYKNNDNTLILNFSKDFLDANENYEKIYSSLIYSLCNDKIKNLIIKVDGQKIDILPNTNKKLPEILNKDFGINKKYFLDDIKGTSQTTIYYSAINNDYKYYIPITKISNDNSEKIEVIISELKKSPIYDTNLISYLNASYELKNYEILENTINLVFDNKNLYNLNDSNIIEEIKYTISQSIKDSYNIDDVSITIN